MQYQDGYVFIKPNEMNTPEAQEWFALNEIWQKDKAIKNAIELLEQNGYTVKRKANEPK
jgi:hypothetical protein